MNKDLKKYFPVFVLPTLLAFIIAFVAPFIMGFGLSFTKFTTVINAKFVGIPVLLEHLEMLTVDN